MKWETEGGDEEKGKRRMSLASRAESRLTTRAGTKRLNLTNRTNPPNKLNKTLMPVISQTVHALVRIGHWGHWTSETSSSASRRRKVPSSFRFHRSSRINQGLRLLLHPGPMH